MRTIKFQQSATTKCWLRVLSAVAQKQLHKTVLKNPKNSDQITLHETEVRTGWPFYLQRIIAKTAQCASVETVVLLSLNDWLYCYLHRTVICLKRQRILIDHAGASSEVTALLSPTKLDLRCHWDKR